VRFTRREAIGAAAAAWPALRAARAAAMPATEPDGLELRRGIDLTPNGVIRPGTPQDYRRLRAEPWAAPLIARASHIRFWADWPALQPTPAALDDPASPGRPSLEALDAQVDAARADGLQVILMPYRYPQWANGATREVDKAAPSYVLPDSGHGPYSPWAGFVEALWARYAGRMTHFEVVNEPNLQLRPQAGLAERVAVMLTTTDAAARRHDLAATCLAPSCSDARVDASVRFTPQPAFADALMRALDRAGFEGGAHWIWSLHDYNETESGEGGIPALRAQLDGRWRGARAPDGGPLVYATEGGVRIGFVQKRLGEGASRAAVLEEQARLVGAALDRAARTPGLGLHTQYTVQADPNYDCGLREADGAARPAFGAYVA
jgi:hypothetical protein